jgi:hypothetical protein
MKCPKTQSHKSDNNEFQSNCYTLPDDNNDSFSLITNYVPD